MKNKLVGFLAVTGVLFQFSITSFVMYMAYLIYVTEGAVNDMLFGALIGLMTGVGLSATIGYVLQTIEVEKKPIE